ncbi:tyrosyl-DNA phosphodiesterase 2-like [Argonauta hians]
MSNSSDEDESQLPSASECKERCDAFVKLTETNSALAMFYLQNCSWDLQCAVNFYFEKSGAKKRPAVPESEPASSSSKGGGGGGGVIVVEDDEEEEEEEKEKEAKKGKKRRVSLEPKGLLQTIGVNEPKRIRVLSWNIDGLDTNNLKARTKAVCQVIANEKPHVVFLQEVVPDSLAVLEKYCPGYHVGVSGDTGYFTATLLKEGDVRVLTEEVSPFFTSVMCRSLLISECVIKGVAVVLINTHLESMASHGSERCRQLSLLLKRAQDVEKERSVIFGGDLNLRDKELSQVGGLRKKMVDMWEATGSRPEAKNTWDTSRNDNKVMPSKFQPKCRFDRIYLRSADPRTLKPVYFELVGLERLPCRRFASDHWGLLSHLDIVGS